MCDVFLPLGATEEVQVDLKDSSSKSEELMIKLKIESGLATASSSNRVCLLHLTYC